MPKKKVSKQLYPLYLDKLEGFVQKGYVVPAKYVQSYMEVFDVPKQSDIRIVQNGTSCGLNSCVWAPNFWLPTAKTAARSLSYNYCTVDKDLGEMFLNFPLPKVFQKVSGINLRQFKDDLGYEDVTERKRKFEDIPLKNFKTVWTRCWMGFKASPFYTAFFYHMAEG